MNSTAPPRLPDFRLAMEAIEDMFRTWDPDEIVPNCTITVNGKDEPLHPTIARWRNRVLAERAQRRAAFLTSHNLPEDSTICADCRGEGRDRGNGGPCWCPMGDRRKREDEQAENAQTHYLVKLLQVERHNTSQRPLL